MSLAHQTWVVLLYTYLLRLYVVFCFLARVHTDAKMALGARGLYKMSWTTVSCHIARYPLVCLDGPLVRNAILCF